MTTAPPSEPAPPADAPDPAAIPAPGPTTDTPEPVPDPAAIPAPWPRTPVPVPGAGEVPVLSALAAATAHLDALTGTDLAALPPADLLAAVDATEALHRRIEAITARVLAAAETDGMWATTGARSFAAWYRARTGRHHTRADKAVTTARRLRDHLPATAAALAAGHISADHAAAMTTHAAATPA
ncbi:13E12 repeat family protein, partial [Georgenia sp. EYE_87]|uniref:DUF222 domain-containing protein n=1 Tax=Georgenia sp. EYE_87 TaxID=2853448 RepID=UPI002005AFF4